MIIEAFLLNNQIKAVAKLLPPLDDALCVWRLDKIGSQHNIVKELKLSANSNPDEFPLCNKIIIDHFVDDFSTYKLDVQVYGVPLKNSTLVDRSI